MLNPASGIGLKAGGPIYVSSFVDIDTTAPNQVIQAASGSKPIGIAQQGSFYAPNLDQALFGVTVQQYAANPTSPEFQIFGLGDVTEIIAATGGGGITAGDFLKPASDGSGYAATATTGDYYGARSFQTVPAGARATVQVMFGKL